MRNIRLGFLLIVSLTLSTLLLPGCAQGGKSPSQSIVATAENLSAQFSVVPDPPIPMREAVLELTLHDTAGRPVEDAIISMELTMPAMRMPLNQPSVEYKGSGVYSANALFTMAGEWQVRVEVDASGQVHEFVFRLRTR